MPYRTITKKHFVARYGIPDYGVDSGEYVNIQTKRTPEEGEYILINNKKAPSFYNDFTASLFFEEQTEEDWEYYEDPSHRQPNTTIRARCSGMSGMCFF